MYNMMLLSTEIGQNTKMSYFLIIYMIDISKT